MTPFWTDDHLTLYGGDCRTVLAELPAESVHCVVTSPPYWGLRDYGVSDQLGLEPTPEEYVANMVAVFREVRRVLRNDGTLWLNLGDSYASHDPGGYRQGEHLNPGGRQAAKGSGRNRAGTYLGRTGPIKPKDLVGIPWRVAFALQADGWYLRSDIIWSKPNPMPESVTDRPTKAHEYLFLLSKAPRYYFDADAVREAGRRDWSDSRIDYDGGMAGERRKVSTTGGDPTTGRNLRSVWTIATEPYPGAHFATFPRKLVEPCVKAGTSERGVCPECGAPWVRVVRVTSPDGRAVDKPASQRFASVDGEPLMGDNRIDIGNRASWGGGEVAAREDVGWRPSCRCGDVPGVDRLTLPDGSEVPEPVPATVLDPFAGSGTTLLVAQALGRRGVGIDLNPEYLKQALVRNAQTPLGLVG